MERSEMRKNVLYAIETLLTSSSVEKRFSAETYLIRFEQSNDSWIVSQEIIKNRCEEYQRLFILQMIRRKCEKDLSILSVSEIDCLKRFLFGLLETEKTKNGLFQICPTLSYLGLNRAWTDPVSELIILLKEKPEKDEAVFLILKGIAEGLKKRPECKEDVDRVVKMCFSYPKENSFLCAERWINACDYNMIEPEHFKTVFLMIKENKTKEISCVATTLLRCIEKSSEKKKEVLFLLQNILFQELKEVLESDEIEEIETLASLFLEYSETFIENIADREEESLYLLEAVMLVINCKKDLLFIEMSFPFWYQLRCELIYRNIEQKKPFYQHYYCFFLLLVEKARLPENKDNVDQDFLDLLSRYRNSLEDVLKDCVDVLGSEEVFQIIFEGLKNSFNSSWKVTESFLFILYMVGGINFEVDNNNKNSFLINKILDFIVQIEGNQRVIYSCLLVVGKYSVFYSNNEEKHSTVFSYILSFINEEEPLGSIASKTLKQLSSSCSLLTLRYVPVLLNSLFSNTRHRCSFASSIQRVIEGVDYETSFIYRQEVCILLFKQIEHVFFCKNYNSLVEYLECLSVFLERDKNLEIKDNPFRKNVFILLNILSEIGNETSEESILKQTERILLIISSVFNEEEIEKKVIYISKDLLLKYKREKVFTILGKIIKKNKRLCFDVIDILKIFFEDLRLIVLEKKREWEEFVSGFYYVFSKCDLFDKEILLYQENVSFCISFLEEMFFSYSTEWIILFISSVHTKLELDLLIRIFNIVLKGMVCFYIENTIEVGAFLLFDISIFIDKNTFLQVFCSFLENLQINLLEKKKEIIDLLSSSIEKKNINVFVSTITHICDLYQKNIRGFV